MRQDDEIKKLESSLESIYNWSLTPAKDAMGADKFDRAITDLQRKYHELTGRNYIFEEQRFNNAHTD